MKRPKRRIYVLEGKTEENIAMAMAVTSRSPEPFDNILAQIDDKKSSNFLERFYITYGHGSIADTAFIHIAIENISQIAVKAIENSRLAAYQEKSTRYQIITRENTVEPEEIKNSKLHGLYEDTINMLYDLYDKFVETLLQQARQKEKRRPEESDGAFENRIRIPVIDRCRLIMPTAVMCNVGLTMSGRSIEYTIAKLASSPLSEVREIAQEMRKVAIKKLPILVKFSDPIKYQIKIEKDLQEAAKTIVGKSIKNNPKKKFVDLVAYDKDALDRVLCSTMGRFSGLSYMDIKQKIKKLSQGQKEKLFDKIIGNRKERHDKPIRELESSDYTFDIVCDFGGFKDLQRHRMTTQTIQPLSTKLGFEEPVNLEETGMASEYRSVMKKAAEAFEEISKKFPNEAQYIVPMAYRRRFLMKMNLREAFYLIELRSRPQGHISYRRVAWQMWDEINKVHPYFAKHIKVDKTL